MDVDKRITVTEFKIFKWTMFKIIKRYEGNYLEDARPLLPITELDINEEDFNN